MYGHFPVNLRFPVLFLSQLPITGSVKLRVFFTVYCYLEFKPRYLKILKLFSIRLKELSEPIVL